MIKQIISALVVLMLVLSVSACKKIDSDVIGNATSALASTRKETRIHNNFKDVLPDFTFDSDPVEKYQEGISYTFSARCSERKFNKYIDKVKKTGFDKNAVEADGYYAACSEEGYYIEATLVNKNITVYTKRK